MSFLSEGFNVEVNGAHKVYFPAPDLWLDFYSVKFSWDPSRESFMALVTLASLPKSGGHSSETLVIYSMPDTDRDTAYRALAEALKMSGNQWKVRKIWFSPRNRSLRGKLEKHGWHDQGH